MKKISRKKSFENRDRVSVDLMIIFGRFVIKLTLVSGRYGWQYGLASFQAGDTKLERFLPKNQHTERKLLNFENWINGKESKSAKI